MIGIALLFATVSGPMVVEDRRKGNHAIRQSHQRDEPAADGPGATGQQAPRLAWLDALRGAAVLGMIVFHAGWDLVDQGLIGDGSGVGAPWQRAGDVVAAVFLAVAGFSLVEARRRGTPLRRTLLRLGRILMLALALTLATWIVAPQEIIWFGILHCIAVGNLLALPLVAAPSVLTLALAALLLAAPALASGLWFDQPLLVWLGLPGTTLATLDFRPLLPWSGYILIGVAAARLLPDPWRDRPVLGPVRGLSLIGRHSLAIYLLHQAVLFPAVFLLARAAGTHPTSWLTAFEVRCRADCRGTGATADLCASTCACVRSTVERSPLGVALQSRSATIVERSEVGRIAGTCFKTAQP